MSEQHPIVLLNKLSPEHKQLFQDQFNKLSQELQNFSFNKLISSSLHIQAESIKREKDKETNIPKIANQQNSQNIPQPLFMEHSQTFVTKTQNDLQYFN